MNDEKRELLIEQLNYFKSLKIIKEQKRYGIIKGNGEFLLPIEYLRAEIYLRANKLYPFSMKPIIWVVNHDHKEAHMGPDLKMSRFTHYSNLFGSHSGDTIRGIFNSLINNALYQDVHIERVTPENVMIYSYKNKEINRPIV